MIAECVHALCGSWEGQGNKSSCSGTACLVSVMPLATTVHVMRVASVCAAAKLLHILTGLQSLPGAAILQNFVGRRLSATELLGFRPGVVKARIPAIAVVVHASLF
jgi:hypothetical protein